jgi:hypothetical protein
VRGFIREYGDKTRAVAPLTRTASSMRSDLSLQTGRGDN